MGSIYLIRHGQASFGADNYDVLSPLGVRQAQIVGQHLVDLGLRFDRCLSGDLSRQQDTARHALQQFSAAGLSAPALEVDPAFNEFDAFGVLSALLEGRAVVEAVARGNWCGSRAVQSRGDMEGLPLRHELEAHNLRRSA